MFGISFRLQELSLTSWTFPVYSPFSTITQLIGKWKFTFIDTQNVLTKCVSMAIWKNSKLLIYIWQNWAFVVKRPDKKYPWKCFRLFTKHISHWSLSFRFLIESFRINNWKKIKYHKLIVISLKRLSSTLGQGRFMCFKLFRDHSTFNSGEDFWYFKLGQQKNRRTIRTFEYFNYDCYHYPETACRTDFYM